jgi:hypothetical protein
MAKKSNHSHVAFYSELRGRILGVRCIETHKAEKKEKRKKKKEKAC